MSQSHTSSQKWSVSSRILHWVSALLLVITWLLILMYDNTNSNLYLGLHKAFGVSVLFWMVARVMNRFLTTVPPAVVMPKWQVIASQFTHLALYVLVIAMPAVGVLMSVYGGRPVDIFGVFQIPVFVTPDRSTARFYNDVHTDIIWPMIVVFTLAHIGAALFHQFIKKDNLIGRMK